MPKAKKEGEEVSSTQPIVPMVPIDGNKEAPSSDVAELKKMIETLTATVTDLSAARQKDAEANQAMMVELADTRSQIKENKEVFDPMSGPGPACEAYKVHKGEGWQLRKQEGMDSYEPVPAGFKIHEVDMIPFIVNENGSYVSNCRSMYSEEYPYKGARRPGTEERPKLKAFLCRHHAKTLLGIALDSKIPDVINELAPEDSSIQEK